MPAGETPSLPRLRQAVIACQELEPTATLLRDRLGLREPFADPGVGYFGLRNAVFAIGDTFLELVAPDAPGTAAGRLLERRGGDCGYMLMFQVPSLHPARDRIRSAGVRVVFEVTLDDVDEVHLHPADMRGAIVSLTAATPASCWRWGGPEWEARSAPGSVAGARVAVRNCDAVAQRWAALIGAPPAQLGVELTEDPDEPGLVEIELEGITLSEPLSIGGVQLITTSEVRR